MMNLECDAVESNANYHEAIFLEGDMQMPHAREGLGRWYCAELMELVQQCVQTRQEDRLSARELLSAIEGIVLRAEGEEEGEEMPLIERVWDEWKGELWIKGDAFPLAVKEKLVRNEVRSEVPEPVVAPMRRMQQMVLKANGRYRWE